jgi:hypothetical protein
MTEVRPAEPRTLRLLAPRFAILRLAPEAPVPEWLFRSGGGVVSLTRTPDELSVVCAEDGIPASTEPCERGWRMLLLEGPIPFETVGVLAALVGPLAEARVPVFAISTYDTDALMVRERDLGRALDVLGRTHRLTRP